MCSHSQAKKTARESLSTLCDYFCCLFTCHNNTVQEFVTRKSSRDEIANVNFLYDIVHALQNAIDWCMNSATDLRGYVLEHMFTKFSEITQYNGHYAGYGHSRLPILVPIESSYTTSY